MGTFELAVVGLTGSGVGTALAMPMVWSVGRREATSGIRLMGWWLLGGSAVGALISARLLGLVPDIDVVDHAVNLIGLSAFPLLCLYVRDQTGLSSRPGAVWWLWTPAGVYAVVLAGRSLLATGTHVPFMWILPVAVGFTVVAAMAAFRRREAAGASGIVPARWIVGAMALLNVAQVVRMVFGDVSPVPAVVPVAIAAIFVAMVGLVARSALDSRPAAATAVALPRYERSGLDAHAAATLFADVERALSADRLFARSDLTLRRLAVAVSATPHQVSEALNRHGVTFHGLLNRRRVEDVKAQLSAPDADRYTIEGIGTSAGFGSRSSMYAAFRRLEGITPAEFRARGRQEADRT